MSRIARALNSGDLSHHEHACDVDVLLAAGAVARRRPLGVLIVEAIEGAAGDGPHAQARVCDLQTAIVGLVSRIAMRWRLAVDARAVARLVVRELVLDRCHVCHGRGYLPLRYDGSRAELGEDSRRRADCHTCLGSGQSRRDPDARARAAGHASYSARLGEWWDAVLTACAQAELSARCGIGRRLRDNR